MQTSKPGEALVKGVEAGSTIAANMNRSRSLQLEADEQSHLLPLKQQMMENQVKEGSLQLATGLKAQEYDLQTKQGQAELADVYTKAANVPDGWANPQVRGWMGEVGKKYPALVGSPAWQHGDQNVQKALDINAEQKRAETMATSRQGVAETQAGGKIGSTLINAGSREAVAGLKTDTEKEIAGNKITSAEKIADENNQMKLQVATLQLKNRLHEERSRINDVTFTSFNKQATAIENDKEMLLPKKQRMIQELQARFEQVLSDRRDAAMPEAVKPSSKPPGYQPAVIGDMPNVTSKDEYDKLPLGTKYVRDGEIFIKK